MAEADEIAETWLSRNATVRLRASRTRRVGPERYEVLRLVELSADRNERLKTARMLSLLEACDLARPS